MYTCKHAHIECTYCSIKMLGVHVHVKHHVHVHRTYWAVTFTDQCSMYL